MNHRVISIGLFVLSILAILSGYFLMYPAVTNWCEVFVINCFTDNWTFGIGQPLYWSTRLLPVLFLALIFVRREVFNAWWKVILPLSIPAFLLIAISPPLPDFLTPDRTEMTDTMVKLIVIVSAIVIAWKYWQLHRAKMMKTTKTA
jgi:hypothetical protein